MNALAREIRREIENSGPITFARFMDIALYAPGLGYYEQPGEIGRHGDFFTSVSTGSLFGQLLAFQFSDWLEIDCPGAKCQLVEAGAHDGRLAVDILDWLSRYRPQLFQRLQYCIVESSPVRRGWQTKILREHLSRVRWINDIRDFGERQINGIIFSNEFFDALPAHRLAWAAAQRQWNEWRVTFNGDAFAWQLGAPAGNLPLPPVPAELAGVLPDGFVTEITPAAVAWWSTAAGALRQGRLFAIDYGFSAQEGLRPDRPQGTLRAFFRHHASADLLANPGEQDLTADVNFSALEEAGRAAGLNAGTLARQSKFLTEILAQIQAKLEAFAPWDEKKSRQFQTLTHPEHLGRAFRCLIQKRPAPI
jgi:SAM-dependent MidA family methyltransferase